MSSNAATFAEERRAAIMEMLEHSASVQVAEILPGPLACPPSPPAPTWTRSRSRQAAPHAWRRRIAPQSLTVSTQDSRINVNVAAKQAIAQSAIELVNDGDTMLVDSGTTALEFVRLLYQRATSPSSQPTLPSPITLTRACPVDVVMLGGACAKAIVICTDRSLCRRSKWSMPILPSCALALLSPVAALRPTFRRWPRPKRL